MNFINFAIDLGTTNSLIAKHHNGNIQLFKNPKGFKETLPSVVAFRKGGILIGDKARELKDRDPKNVFSSFKRKMGTDETYLIHETGETIDPIKLSSYILNELKTFLREENIRSSVITIPASFDTVQSNATRQAGLLAGFEEVILLQEPIAACLAVFNQQHIVNESGKWLIYDLGGGTFDVAIVSASEEELKVIDHEGNNFLGGLDFDILLLNELIIPQLTSQGKFTETCNALLSNPDKAEVQPIYNYLLFYSEQLKIELTSYPEGYIEFELRDDNGEVQDIALSIKREDFNRIIDHNLDHTVRLVGKLLETNGLSNSDFKEIILVGGSTYIPYVREKLEKELSIPVNQKVDPTNAIAIGAAFYAGNKPSKLNETVKNLIPADKIVHIKPAYERQSRELNALVLLKSEGNCAGLFYRVFRKDLGYDSGKKQLTSSERLLLPLNARITNDFQIEIYSDSGELIDPDAGLIQITQGLFIIDGQPLPHDICIEIDDVESGATFLEPVFNKNDILPLSKTIYKMLSRDLLESNDDELIINILEGDKNASPTTNQIIGCISIRPKEIRHNLFRDTDIGITLKISESRDLTVSAAISMINFEVKDVFSPTQKTVHLSKLREELKFLHFSVSKDLKNALENEEFEIAAPLRELQEECEKATITLGSKNEITADTKYHLQEMKRQMSVTYDKLFKKQKMLSILNEYRYIKSGTEYYLGEEGFPEKLKRAYQDICKNEEAAIASGNIAFLRSLKNRLRNLNWEYERSSTNQLRSIYIDYKMLPAEAFTNRIEASRIMETGDQLLERESSTTAEYISVISKLYQLLKPAYRLDGGDEKFDLKGTGLR